MKEIEHTVDSVKEITRRDINREPSFENLSIDIIRLATVREGIFNIG